MIMSPYMFDGIGRFFKELFLWKIWFYHYADMFTGSNNNDLLTTSCFPEFRIFTSMTRKTSRICQKFHKKSELIFRFRKTSCDE